MAGKQGDHQAIHEPLHPRPQLTRARWVDLSGPWGFAHDDSDVGVAERWFERVDPFARTITVPFPPESPASGIGDTGYHPIVWYRRAVAIPALDPGGSLFLHCGAVDYRAQVWVNGRHVAEHEGGLRHPRHPRLQLLRRRAAPPLRNFG